MATTPTGAGLTKGARITGADRQALGAQLSERYQAGESIRALAQETGRSFGFVHGVIKESGVTLRGRGGATRRSVPAAVATTPAAAESSPEAKGAGKTRKTEVKKAVKRSASKKDDGKKDDGKKDEGKKDEGKRDEGKKDEGKKEKSAGKKKGRS